MYQLQAQNGNTLIMGTVQNDSFGFLSVDINKRYLNNSMDEYKVGISPQGTYGVSVQLELPQMVQVRYQHRSIEVFLAPNDTLILDFDTHSFPKKKLFKGSAALNNQFWEAFSAQFPQEAEIFQYRQYRRGIYYYKIHHTIDDTMQKLAPEAYFPRLNREFLTQKAFLGGWKSEHSEKLSHAFENYLNAEINYRFLYQKLAYTHVYRGRYRLDSTYFSFLDSLSAQFRDEYVSNPMYREFAFAFNNYWAEKNYQKTSPDYPELYQNAQKSLANPLAPNGHKLTRFAIMAQIIQIALKKENPASVLDIYEHFLKENPYLELDKLVTDAMQMTRPFAAGTQAPDFVVRDTQDLPFLLRNLRGKYVYLDFWAGWCRPCMNKLQSMQGVEGLYAGKNIAFVHISIDNNPEIWKNTLQKYQFEGLHLYSEPQSQLIFDYNILSVPKYFILDPNGRFVHTPTAGDVETLKETLDKILR
jgi:thiol-disulfide isomerase/thioredoxin